MTIPNLKQIIYNLEQAEKLLDRAMEVIGIAADNSDDPDPINIHRANLRADQKRIQRAISDHYIEKSNA